jgi:hypothetical protein
MKLILIIIIIVILIYISCYYIFPNEITILQTTIEHFDFNLLSSRQPIIISDYIKEPEEIINSWFKYNITSKEENDEIEENIDWQHNNHKYIYINANEDTELIIYKAQITKINPKPDDKIIIIKLEKNQSIILPFKWKYYGDKINKYYIDDIITFFSGRLV